VPCRSPSGSRNLSGKERRGRGTYGGRSKEKLNLVFLGWRKESPESAERSTSRGDREGRASFPLRKSELDEGEIQIRE